MFKIVGLLLVVCGCTAMGLSAGNEMERRIRELRELLKLLEILEGEIGYANAALAEAFRHGARRMAEPFSGFLEHMAKHMDEFRGDTLGEIFMRHVQEDLKGTALCRKDLDALTGFGEQLGYLDVKMQLAAIGLYKEQLTHEYVRAREDCRKNSKLYRCLGLMGGLFLALIFF